MSKKIGVGIASALVAGALVCGSVFASGSQVISPTAHREAETAKAHRG